MERNNIKPEKKKKTKEKFIITFFLILVITGLVTVILVSIFKNSFKPKAQRKQQSLKRGLGFYSDPTFTRCQNSDGGTNCNKPSTQNVIYECIPHPVTQKGCINKGGNFEYGPKVTTQVCNLPCVQSKMIQQDKYQLELINGISLSSKGKVVNTPLYAPIGSGCNNIVNKYTGLNNTDYFLEKGSYNKNSRSSYALNHCIPSNEFVGYSVTSVHCLDNKGIKGTNNCNVSCGNKNNTLKYSGIFGSDLSSNVLQYYPTEYDEEGVRRNVCYNLFGTNQVEILNRRNIVPDNFYFPTKCYSVYNTQKNIPLNKYFPTGISGTYDVNNYFDNKTKYFLLDNTDKDISAILDIDNFESIYQNYNNYTFVSLGKELALLESLKTKDVTGYVKTSINNIDNYFGYGYYKADNPISIHFGDDNHTPIDFNENKVINKNNFYEVDLKQNQIFTSSDPIKCSYIIEGNKTYITVARADLLLPNKFYGIYYVEKSSFSNSNKVIILDSSSKLHLHIFGIIAINKAISSTNSAGEVYIWIAKNPVMPVVNNFYDNFYISGVQLTTSNNYGRNDETNILINNNNLTNLGTSAYYYYGKKTGAEQGQNYFYYPLYTNNTGGNEGISFVNINYSFYTPDTSGHSLGPPSAGIKNLNIELGTVEIKLKYPEIPVEGISFFPTGFDIVSPGISYDGSNSFSSIDNGFTVNLKPSSDNKNTFFASLLRSKSLTLPEPQNNNQGEKIKSYLDALDNVVTLNNLESEDVNLTIYPEKNYILAADYDVFLSPYKIDSKGKINRLCYDENNKQLPRGTTTTLKSDETVYYNNRCSDYNIEGNKSALCGNYVLEDKSSCVQSIQDKNPRFRETCSALNVKNTYFNNKGFLEEGLFQENVLTCDSEDCFPLKYTQEANTSLTNYELNDEAYLNLQKKDYYVSNVNNNDFDPLNPLYWTRVFPYIQGENVNIGQKFFIKPQDQDTIYIYECIEEGVAPYGIENLSIDFQYKKDQPIYTTFTNSNLTVVTRKGPNGAPFDYFNMNFNSDSNLTNYYYYFSYVFASKFPVDNVYNVFFNSIQNITYTLYSNSLNNLSIDINVPNLNSNQGDKFNPSFSFWSKLIIYFSFSSHSLEFNKYFFFGSIVSKDLTNTQEGLQTIELKFSKVHKFNKGDYAALVPVTDGNIIGQPLGKRYQDLYNLMIGKYSISTTYDKSQWNLRGPPTLTNARYITRQTSNVNDNEKYLGEFEVVNIENVSGKDLTIRRNILGTGTENLFTSDEFAYLAMIYIPPEFINLEYEITSSVSNNSSFTISSTINNTIGISSGDLTKDGTSYIINSNDTDIIPYQTYYTSKVISNNIVYPSTENNGSTYYIINNNYNSQLYNTITEIYDSGTCYYFNEYRENILDSLAFNIGDTISITIKKNIYDFTITNINSRELNKTFDYKCIDASDNKGFF